MSDDHDDGMAVKTTQSRAMKSVPQLCVMRGNRARADEMNASMRVCTFSRSSAARRNHDKTTPRCRYCCDDQITTRLHYHICTVTCTIAAATTTNVTTTSHHYSQMHCFALHPIALMQTPTSMCCTFCQTC